MQVGSLVKWMLRGDDYGEMGIVTEVFDNYFRVFWVKCNNQANHGKGTKHIKIMCE